MEEYTIIKRTDLFNYPVYIITANTHFISEAAWDSYFSEYRNIFTSATDKFYIIWNMQAITWIPWKKLKDLYELHESLREPTSVFLIASSPVISSDWAKMFINHLLVAYKNTRPIKITTSLDKSIEYLKRF